MIRHKSRMFKKPLRGLVGWWPMREGTCTTLKDVIGGNDATLVGSPSWDLDDGANGVIYNGSSQYATVADAAALRLAGVMTISIDFQIDTDTDHVLLQKGTTTEAGSYRLAYNSASQKIRAFRGDGSSDDFINATSVLSTGVRYHLVVVWTTATTAVTYQDGVSTESGTIGGTPADSGGALRIAANNSAGELMPGRVYGLSIWDRTLSEAEANQDYRAGAF